MKLQILEWRYLLKTQIADRNLCITAKKVRKFFAGKNDSQMKRVFRFLAFVNQSDWRASRLLALIDAIGNENQIQAAIKMSVPDFTRRNKLRERKSAPLLPDSDLDAIMRVAHVSPLHLGIIDAADNWVADVQKDMGRLPNENEWQRLLASPLDGVIGMSLALQWRYNFGPLFGKESDNNTADPDEGICD